MADKKVIVIDDTEKVHGWFELTYAQYLTIPRSVLQSMPDEWQKRFVKCLEELDNAIDWRPKDACYWVQLRGYDGKFISIENDPFMDYERGRRRVAFRECPLCGKGTTDGKPHKECADKEDYLADKACGI